MKSRMLRSTTALVVMALILTGCGMFNRSPTQTVEDFY